MLQTSDDYKTAENMEEIYIIRLKGLPASSQESLRDNKASFYYRKDLTGEALLGFGILHTFVGSILIILSVINLFLHETKAQILGSGVWCGSIFAIAGFMGIVTAHKRKTDISKSKIQVKIFFTLSIVTFLLTSTYLTLLAFDMKEPTANQHIGSNILLSFIFELITSLLSVFTCIRIIWPGSMSCCAKDWPMQPKLKRKVIVSTKIYTNGVKQDEDLIRNLGPNCVISLTPQQTNGVIRSDTYSLTTDGNEFAPMCDYCLNNFNDGSVNKSCNHNIISNMSECENDGQFDSDFETENYDSMVEQESDVKPDNDIEMDDIELVDEHNENADNIEIIDENEIKYEIVCQNSSSTQTNDGIIVSEMTDNEDSVNFSRNEETVKSFELSKESLTIV